MVALLDVNVLLAFAWPSHVHHQAARRWAEAHMFDWATTTITQLGFVRVSANPTVFRDSTGVAAALDALRALVALPGHRFLVDDVEPARALDDDANPRHHRQVTDAHLLALAARHAAELVTFDRRLPALLAPANRARVRVIPNRSS